MSNRNLLRCTDDRQRALHLMPAAKTNRQAADNRAANCKATNVSGRLMIKNKSNQQGQAFKGEDLMPIKSGWR